MSKIKKWRPIMERIKGAGINTSRTTVWHKLRKQFEINSVDDILANDNLVDWFINQENGSTPPPLPGSLPKPRQFKKAIGSIHDMPLPRQTSTRPRYLRDGALDIKLPKSIFEGLNVFPGAKDSWNRTREELEVDADMLSIALFDLITEQYADRFMGLYIAISTLIHCGCLDIDRMEELAEYTQKLPGLEISRFISQAKARRKEKPNDNPRD